MRLCPYPIPAYVGAWCVGAFYNITPDILAFGIKPTLVFNTAHFTIWMLLGLVAIPLVRRWPVTRSPLSWARQLALGAVFTMVDLTLGHWIGFRILGLATEMSVPQVAVFAFRTCFHLGMINYVVMLAAVQIVDAQHRERDQRTLEGELRAAWGEARLRHLRSQLHPHFLFNALHTVGALMHRDVAAAERVLERVAHLLRLSLRETDQKVVELGTELAFIEAYCEIEKTRFEHRLDLTLSVPAALRSAAIPPLILQPLVENAIKYGVTPHPQGGRVVVRAYQELDALVLEVQNEVQGDAMPNAGDGVRETGSAIRPGLGLSLDNIRTRLRALYGSASGLELLRIDAGAIARIRLPWVPTGAPAMI
jgi:two-component system LytT family sensor kinase